MTGSELACQQQTAPMAPFKASQQQLLTSADHHHRTAESTGPQEAPLTQQDAATGSTAAVADAVWPHALPTRDSLGRSLSVSDLPAVVLQPQRNGFQGRELSLHSRQLLLPDADQGYRAHAGAAAAAAPQVRGYDWQLADQPGAALASRGSRLPPLSVLETSAFIVKNSRPPYRAPAMYLTHSGRAESPEDHAFQSPPDDYRSSEFGTFMGAAGQWETSHSFARTPPARSPLGHMGQQVAAPRSYQHLVGTAPLGSMAAPLQGRVESAGRLASRPGITVKQLFQRQGPPPGALKGRPLSGRGPPPASVQQQQQQQTLLARARLQAQAEQQAHREREREKALLAARTGMQEQLDHLMLDPPRHSFRGTHSAAGLDAMPIQQPPSAGQGAQASLAIRVQDRHFSVNQPWPGKPSEAMFALTLPGTAADEAAGHRRAPPHHRDQQAAGAAPFEDPGPFTVSAPEADSDADLPILGGLPLPDTDMLAVDHDRFPSPPPLFMIGSPTASPGVPPPAATSQMLDGDPALVPQDNVPSAIPGHAGGLAVVMGMSQPLKAGQHAEAPRLLVQGPPVTMHHAQPAETDVGRAKLALTEQQQRAVSTELCRAAGLGSSDGEEDSLDQGQKKREANINRICRLPSPISAADATLVAFSTLGKGPEDAASVDELYRVCARWRQSAFGSEAPKKRLGGRGAEDCHAAGWPGLELTKLLGSQDEAAAKAELTTVLRTCEAFLEVGGEDGEPAKWKVKGDSAVSGVAGSQGGLGSSQEDNLHRAALFLRIEQLCSDQQGMLPALVQGMSIGT